MGKDVRTQFRSILILTGMFLLVMCSGAIAEPQYTTTCSSCHGMPPLDGATRNPDTGAFKGNHQTHLAPTGVVANSCLPCHNTASYTNGHLSGTVTLQTNINNSPYPSTGGRYMISGSPITFKNQTSNPVLGTCANVNCHFETTTPTWGVAAFSSKANCQSCHTPLTDSVSHAKHFDYYSSASRTDACTKCHPNYASPLMFDHATSVSNRVIKVQLAEGTYAGGTNSLNYLPSQSGRTFGSCSAAYCHSPGDKNSAYTAPNTAATWGTTLDCKGCHRFDSASGAAMNTPVAGFGHTLHVTATIASSIKCYECHAATATGANTIKSKAVHTDKLVTVKFSSQTTAVNGTYAGTAASGANTFTRVPGVATGGACRNVYCHSDGTKSAGVFTVMSTPRWGMTLPTLAANCTGCHGGDNTRPASRQINTNAHNSHIAGGTQKSFGCADCHATTVSGNTTVSTLANHVNYVVDVSISANYGGSYVGDNTKPGAGTGTCTTVYCHSNGKNVYPATPATWATPNTGQCGTCHAVTPTIAATVYGAANTTIINTNAHFDHLSSSFGPKMTRAEAGCALCHTYTTAVAATHVNKTVDAPLANCTGCHKQMATIQWNTSSVSCESCHTTTAGALSVINTVTAPDKTAFAVSGHAKAGLVTTGGKGSACIDCHTRTSRHITNLLGDSNRVLTAMGTGDTRSACDYCHTSSKTIVTNVLWRNMSTHFLTLNGPQAMECQACHDPHGGGTNLKMIASAVQFRTSSYSVTIANLDTDLVNTSTNRGFCQVCHRTTAYFKKGIATSNHPTTGCLNCHSHNAKGGAFKASGACNACHGYPPVPRNAASTPTSTFGVTIKSAGNYADAEFENYSGGGGAHIVGKHVPATVTASQGWAACTPCHSGSEGAHVKSLPIKSYKANVSVTMDPKKRFTPAGFFGYSGAKLVNPPASNKTGTCFNVNCHFTKSPRWSTTK